LGVFARMIQSQTVSGRIIPCRFFIMQLAIRKSARAPDAFHCAPQAFPIKAI
jgi:hypothetical protein